MIEFRPLPMKEAIQFWQDKKLVSPSKFDKLTDEAKLRAFAVSGIAKGAELETVYNAIGKALAQGTTFGDFKKDCQTVFEKRGWTGPQAYRLDNIFRTNVQTAYMAGRYKQAMAVSARRPFWQYVAVNDRRTRPTHRALNGMVFRFDNKFWDTGFPPNGYRCRCSFRTLSDTEMDNEGLSVEERNPIGSYVIPTDPKTGAKMPPVQIMPDTGFAFNPGKAYWDGIAPREDKLPQRISPIISGQIREIKNYKTYNRPDINSLPESAYRTISSVDILPDIDSLKKTGMTQDAAEKYYLTAFLSEFGIKPGETTIFKDKAGEHLIIGDAIFREASGKLKVTKRGREQYIKLLARTIMDPYEIWLIEHTDKNTGRISLRRRYIRAFIGEDKKISGYAAFEYGSDGWTGITAFVPDDLKYANDQRTRKLLYGE